MDAKDRLIRDLRRKMAQARETIRALASDGGSGHSTVDQTEAARALAYFSSEAFDENFRFARRSENVADEGLRPEDLNAANDD
jgi:hypothetical protein